MDLDWRQEQREEYARTSETLGVSIHTPELLVTLVDAVEAFLEAPEVRRDLREAYLKEAYHNLIARIADSTLGACPKCAGTMIARKGKYGGFWGCDQYPVCSFTRNFE